MRNLLNPRWPILLNTLPVLALLGAFLWFYLMVSSQLTSENKLYWSGFFFTTLTLALIHLTYSLWLIYRKKHLSVYYGIVAVLVYTVLIYVYWNITHQIFPPSIPTWVIPANLIFYVGTSLMPTLVHSLYVIVCVVSKEASRKSGWLSFIAALVIPFFWYLFFQGIFPLSQRGDSELGFHIGVILIVLSTVLFVFCIIRFVFIMSTNRTKYSRVNHQAWAIIVGIILPVLGLMLNNGKSILGLDPFGESVFGDFSSPWYLVIAIVNGLALFLSTVDNNRYRLVLFVIKSIGFTYALYFFVIFLPYLPLSILLIIVIGAGFLMLTPIALMMVQARSMLTDYDYLKSYYSKRLLVGLFLAGALLLPTCITATYWHDRQELRKAMAYIFDNEQDLHPGDISKAGLRRTLSNVKTHQGTDVFFGTGKPILTPFYTWLVLDNMTLPEYKANIMKEVFFGTSDPGIPGNFSATNRNSAAVEISDARVTSNYQVEGYWLSTIELDITNNSNRAFSEYVGNFELPTGSWIKDYYLYIEDRKEHGILAEKKTAAWLYQQIVRGPRDPGILYYMEGNSVAFRVFPFAKGQTRTTGIQLIHKEPVNFKIDKAKFSLGHARSNPELKEPIKTANGYYLSQQLKKQLPYSQRKPYFHFIVDCSEGSEKLFNDYMRQVKSVFHSHDIGKNEAKISYVNAGVKTHGYDPSVSLPVRFEGGFFLEKAIKQALVSNYESMSDTFPVFIVLTNDIRSAVFIEDLSDYAFCFPELDQFFSITGTGLTNRFSLLKKPQASQGKATILSELSDFLRPSLKWQDEEGRNYFLATDEQPSILPIYSVLNTDTHEDNTWLEALDAQCRWKAFQLGSEEPQRDWLRLVRSSFETQVMNPTTSFLALENESQKELLRRKQQQVLSGNKSFELGDDVYRMSEPGWWFFVFCLLIVVGLKVLVHVKSKKDQIDDCIKHT